MNTKEIKLICFYGPESTGKTEMAKKMASYYQTEFVPEVAREMITSNSFTAEDIIKIGKAQTQRIKDKLKLANRFLFCDSDLITTQIYSQVYLKEVPPILLALENEVVYDQFFLFDINVPWVADGMRGLGTKREEMFSIFKNELEKRSITYQLVTGDWENREKTIHSTLRKMNCNEFA